LQRVDCRDLAVNDREGEHRDRDARLGGDEAGCAVDDRRVHGARAREEPRAGRHRPSALDDQQRAIAVVGAQDERADRGHGSEA